MTSLQKLSTTQEPIAVLEMHEIRRRLHATLFILRQNHHPDVRRKLLVEIRLLISRLDRLVLESTNALSLATSRVCRPKS